MKIIESVAEMSERSRKARGDGRRIGFVPTMGYLHEGHMSLVRRARELADWTVVSLFVNPTQFGPTEDLDRYPRNLPRDTDLCRKAGVDVLFVPQASEMYPGGFSVYVEETRLSRGLCGATRPGHFRGVTTVVAKLFNIVQPDWAVFGQKDAQQVRVIRQMVRDLAIPVQVEIAPTVRESDGLAMSSRNAYLSPDERRRALCLSASLQVAETMYAAGERSVEPIRAAVREKILDGLPPVSIDYVAFVDDLTLEPVEEVRGRVLLALAVRIGATRLIDNTVLG